MAKVGFEGKFSIGDTPTELAKAQDVSLNLSADAVETTARDDAGWKNNEQGLKSWSISGNALWVPDNTALELLRTAYLNRTKIAVELLDGTGGDGYEGVAIITSLGREEPLNGAMTLPFEMTGCGALTVVDPA